MPKVNEYIQDLSDLYSKDKVISNELQNLDATEIVRVAAFRASVQAALRDGQHLEPLELAHAYAGHTGLTATVSQTDQNHRIHFRNLVEHGGTFRRLPNYALQREGVGRMLQELGVFAPEDSGFETVLQMTSPLELFHRTQEGQRANPLPEHFTVAWVPQEQATNVRELV